MNYGIVPAVAQPRCRPAQRRVVLALASAALLIAPLAARAQVAIEVVEAGWDGAAVANAWTPVRLRAKGGPREMRVLARVVIDAEIPTGAQGSLLRVPVGAYGQELALGAGESREITLWFPADGPLRLRAELLQDDRVVARAEAPLRRARYGWPLVAVLADGPAIARALRSIELPYQGLPVPLGVTEIGPIEVPRTGDLLDGIDALVIEGAGPAELTDSQREAVLYWVRSGGHLVLAGGPAAVHAVRVLPEQALPLVAVEFLGETTTGSLADWIGRADAPRRLPLARFRTRGGALLAGTVETPVAWRTALGRGTVTLLAFDPALEPISSWAGAPTMWRTALAPALAGVGVPSGPTVQPVLSSLRVGADLLPADAYPDWRLAVGLLILFALGVGPVQYWVLRRLDRHELAWVVVPVAALGMAVAAYSLGFIDGKQGITNITTYIEIDGDGRDARQSSVAAFYGSLLDEVVLPLPDGVPLRAAGGDALPFEMFAGNPSKRDSARPGTLEGALPFQVMEGARRSVRFNGGNLGLRQVSFERRLDEAPRIEADLTAEAGLLVGTVRNASGVPLDHVAVVVGRKVARLGTIAPGQSVPVRFDPTPTPSRFYFPSDFSRLLLGKPRRVPNARSRAVQAGAGSMSSGPAVLYPEYGNVPNDPETQRRARLVDRVISTDHPIDPGLPLTLLAFTTAPIASPSIPLDGKRLHELTLIRKAVELALRPGRFAIPAPLTNPDLLESTGSWGGDMSDRGPTIQLHEGSMTFAFRPALPAAAQIETLILTTQQPARSAARSGGPAGRATAPTAAPALDGVFSIYDWQLAEWRPLPRALEHRLMAAGYVGPEREIRVRAAAPDDRPVSFFAPTLAVEGRVQPGAGR